MEIIAEPEIKTKPQTAKKTSTKKGSAIKKLSPECAKILETLKEKANKKNFGRRVRDSDIIHRALKLVTGEHIVDLQNETLSEKDRLEMAFEDYQKAHGKLTMDQFIGKLMRGEIRSTTL